MKHPLFLKCALLALLGAALLIPLSLIERSIEERTEFRAEAIRAIAASSAGEQSLLGPVLTIPVVEEYDEPGTKQVVRCKRTHLLTVYPRQLDLKGNLNVDRRAYGVHSVAVYEMQGVVSGRFDLPGASALPPLGRNAVLAWGTPIVSLGVSDARGLVGEPSIKLAGTALSARRGAVPMFAAARTMHDTAAAATAPADSDDTPSAARATQDARLQMTANGFHALAEHINGSAPASVPFEVQLNLAGTGSFGFVPVGETSSAELHGNWPHPSFGGGYLPRERDVTQDGFAARWATSALATNGHEPGARDGDDGFRVRLIDPVDIYRQALRAVKYGALFVVLSFSTFFAFEHLRRLPIHPIQYLLVGLAQAVFFLLLTSLSEHIAFLAAYWIAAAASIALIGVYLAAVLRGWRRGLGFSAALAVLYGALYGILRSEQNAFLLGSLLLFLALAGLMLGTRRLDWYRLNHGDAADRA